MRKSQCLEAHRMSSVVRVCVLLILSSFLTPFPAAAQATPPPASAAQQQAEPDPDLQLKPGQPDFTLSALPTTLRMPSHKFAFRITHRFTRPIASGSVGDFFAD